jgi:uncharacterized membrane protein
MVATVSWIGGLFFQATVLNPVLAGSTHTDLWQDVLHAMRRRFEPIAWLSLALLVATGLVQMEANPQYLGFLAVSNRWAQAILIKHLLIAVIVVAAAFQTWYLQPKLERALLMQAKGLDGTEQRDDAVRSQARLTRFNLALGLLVLALTAFARTA